MEPDGIQLWEVTFDPAKSTIDPAAAVGNYTSLVQLDRPAIIIFPYISAERTQI
jgi:hypothetical protein